MWTRPNPTIAQAKFIILSSDEEMLALEEMLRLACPDRDFRSTTDWLFRRIIEMCCDKQTVKEEIDSYINTAVFTACLPYEITSKLWRIYIVNADGEVDTADRREFKRQPREVVSQLVRNIQHQLAIYQLYDASGKLMFEYDYIVPEGSLEIRLRRLE